MSTSVFKSGLAALFAIIMMLLNFRNVNVGTGSTGNAGGSYPPADPPSDPPEVVLAIEYSNFAWGYQQDVTVVTNTGACYRKSVRQDNYDWQEIDKISVDINDYNSLVEMTKDPANALNEKKNMNIVWTYYPKFAEWSKMPMKDYGSMACDYGSRTLYGFYKEGAEVKCVEIAGSGDWESCVDDKDAIDFANEMLPRLPGFDFT